MSLGFEIYVLKLNDIDSIACSLEEKLWPTSTAYSNKGLSSQSYDGFSSSHVWIWESWTIKKAERQRIDAFKQWCCRRLLRLPWTARRSNHPILNEISPEYSPEGLKLKLQFFGHLMWKLTHLKRPWCWERVKAGWEGDDRRWDGWMASLTRWTWVWVCSGSWWWTGKPGMLQSMRSQSQTQLSDWTELKLTQSQCVRLIFFLVLLTIALTKLLKP